MPFLTSPGRSPEGGAEQSGLWAVASPPRRWPARSRVMGPDRASALTGTFGWLLLHHPQSQVAEVGEQKIRRERVQFLGWRDPGLYRDDADPVGARSQDIGGSVAHQGSGGPAPDPSAAAGFADRK